VGVHVLVEEHAEAEEGLADGFDHDLVYEHVFGQEVGEEGVLQLLLGQA
jgi:hypothetical protein